MKKIVRYLLEGDGKTPVFIENGGYFLHNEELVGRSVDESIRHVPSTIVRMDRAALLARIKLAHQDAQGNYLLNAEGQQWTDQNMDSKLLAFLELVEMEDLQ